MAGLAAGSLCTTPTPQPSSAAWPLGAAAQAAALHSKAGAWLKPCPIGATTSTTCPLLFVFGIIGIRTRNVQRHRECTSRSPPRLPSHARAGHYRAAPPPLLMMILWDTCSAIASNNADADADATATHARERKPETYSTDHC